jgi:Ring finger domain
MLSSSSRGENFAGEMKIKAHEIDNSEPLNTQSNDCTGITLLLCEIPNNESREESEDLIIEGIDVESPDQYVKVQKELSGNKKLYSADNSNDVKLHEITPGGIDAESSHEVTDAHESIEKKQENINYEDLKTANFTLDDDLMGASLRSVSTIDQGVLIISTEIGERRVPNCCAICLASYEFEDSVVWSTNAECIHAFHEDCVMDWLIKMYETYPCPCCRSPFVEIHTRKKKEKPILWEPGHAMNLNIISF